MADLPISLDPFGSLTATSAVPSARQPHEESQCPLDQIGDEERWLWRVVEEAERVAVAAPAGVDPQRLAVAEERYQQACAVERRIASRIKLTEAALTRPSSWLRPAHRAELMSLLRSDRAAAVAAAVQRSKVEEVLRRLRTLATSRAEYLAEHRVVLGAGDNARIEIQRIVDYLIAQYARMPEQPVWFRFGLGYPPERGKESAWLDKARETITERRRRLLNDPVSWLH